MKKIIYLLCLTVMPLHAGFGENVLNHLKQQVENITLENALEDYQRQYAELTGIRYPHGAC